MQHMKISQLKKHAIKEGVSTLVLEEADDEDDVKATVIAHILNGKSRTATLLSYYY